VEKRENDEIAENWKREQRLSGAQQKQGEFIQDEDETKEGLESQPEPKVCGQENRDYLTKDYSYYLLIYINVRLFIFKEETN
jgi:hypothetical protein